MIGRSTTRQKSTSKRKARAFGECSRIVRRDLRDVHGVRGDLRLLNDYCEGTRGVATEAQLRTFVQYCRDRGLAKERMQAALRGFGDDIVHAIYAQKVA